MNVLVRSEREIMKSLKWIILAVLAIVLVITNPSSHLYSVWAVQIIQRHTSSLISGLASVFAGPLETAIYNNTIRENLLLFSVYKTTLMGHVITVDF